jgi:hypothetical protein
LEIERAKLKPLPSRRTDDHEEELQTDWLPKKAALGAAPRMKIGYAKMIRAEYEGRAAERRATAQLAAVPRYDSESDRLERL